MPESHSPATLTDTSQATVTLQSERLGQLTIPANQCFTLVSPLLGFEDETRFAIVEHEADSPFQWLQSLATPSLTFIVTVPALFNLDFSFTLPNHAQTLLQVSQAEDLWLYTLVTIPHDDPQAMTTNLMAPLLFNPAKQLAMQLVLEDAPAHYTTKVPLLANPQAKEG